MNLAAVLIIRVSARQELTLLIIFRFFLAFHIMTWHERCNKWVDCQFFLYLREYYTVCCTINNNDFIPSKILKAIPWITGIPSMETAWVACVWVSPLLLKPIHFSKTVSLLFNFNISLIFAGKSKISNLRFHL